MARIRTGPGFRPDLRALILGGVCLAVAAVLPTIQATAAPTPIVVTPLTSVFRLPGPVSSTVAFQFAIDGAVRPRAVFDVSPLAGTVSVTAPGGCTATATTITCPLTDPGDHLARIDLTLDLLPGAGTMGRSGRFDAMLASDNLPEAHHFAQVQIADSGALVATATGTAPGPAKPGEVLTVGMSTANLGDTVETGGYFEVTAGPGLMATRYQGCGYDQGADRVTRVRCPIGAPLAPGAEVRFVTLPDGPGGRTVNGMTFTVAPDAFHTTGVGYSLLATEGFPAPRPAAPAETTGTAYRVDIFPTQATAPQYPDESNHGGYFWDVTNTMDLAAVGDTATGVAGTVVTIAVGVRNVGPATVDYYQDGFLATTEYHVVMPPGVEVLAAPANCWSQVAGSERYLPSLAGAAGGTRYVCRDQSPGHERFFDAGASALSPFTLKITQVVPNATGSVSLWDPEVGEDSWTDANAANDDATVVINPEPLPITGPAAGTTAGVGAALLAVGLGLIAATRRRHRHPHGSRRQ